MNSPNDRILILTDKMTKCNYFIRIIKISCILHYNIITFAQNLEDRMNRKNALPNVCCFRSGNGQQANYQAKRFASADQNRSWFIFDTGPFFRYRAKQTRKK